MRRTLLALLLAGATACGGPGASVPETTPAQAMTAEQHLAEADRKDAEAAELEARAESTTGGQASDAGCGDTVAADQVTSGGERLHVQPTCLQTGPIPGDLRARARQLREEARQHRAAAQPPEE
jgi:hypothetical protein